MNARQNQIPLDLTKQNSVVRVDLMAGQATVGFEIRGMPANGSVGAVVEGTLDGTHYAPLIGLTGLQEITADGQYFYAVGGLHSVQLRVNNAAVGAGSAYVAYVLTHAAPVQPNTFGQTAIDTVAIALTNTPQQLPNVPMGLGGSIINHSSSADVIYVGTSNLVTAAAHGWPLAVGQVLGVGATNLSAYWMYGGAGDQIAYTVN